MKNVIREFCENLEAVLAEDEYDYKMQKNEFNENYRDARRDIIEGSSYKALKSLLDKPIVKENLITDEMITIVCNVYWDKSKILLDRILMKAALEAVFDHIANDGKKVGYLGGQYSHTPPERPLKEPEEKQTVKKCDQSGKAKVNLTKIDDCGCSFTDYFGYGHNKVTFCKEHTPSMGKEFIPKDIDDTCSSCAEAVVIGMKDEITAICSYCEAVIEEKKESQKQTLWEFALKYEEQTGGSIGSLTNVGLVDMLSNYYEYLEENK